jgi:hypothetical protein
MLKFCACLELLVWKLSFYYRKNWLHIFHVFYLVEVLYIQRSVKGSNKLFLVNVEPPIVDNSMYILIRDWIAQSSERSNEDSILLF